jgi:hypothetical protein
LCLYYCCVAIHAFKQFGVDAQYLQGLQHVFSVCDTVRPRRQVNYECFHFL